MKLNAPKNVTFIIGVILLVAGLILAFADPFGIIRPDSGVLYYLIIFAGGALLALGNLLKGL